MVRHEAHLSVRCRFMRKIPTGWAIKAWIAGLVIVVAAVIANNVTAASSRSATYESGLQAVPEAVVSEAISNVNRIYCQAGGFKEAYAGGSTTVSDWEALEPLRAQALPDGTLDPTTPVYAVFVSGTCWLSADETGAPLTGGRVLLSGDGTVIGGQSWGGEQSSWPPSDPPFGGPWNRSDSGVGQASAEPIAAS